jgi:hypothetical protein
MGTLSVDNIEERSTGKGQNVLSGQAKVWASWQPDGTLLDSLNTSSITDAGTGDWDVNLTSSLADTNHARFWGTDVASFADEQASGDNASVSLIVTNAARMNNNTVVDPNTIFCSAFGDLA